VAETIATLDQPTILDLEHLSKTRQLRFLSAFFERLYDKNRDPLLLLLDEAQRYAPQRPMSPDATTCLGAVEDLVKLGRKHGIGPVLFTQRGSGLNKEVSELCDMLVAFRTPGSLDQDRIKDWLGANAGRGEAAEIMGTISGLHTGTAVFASNHPQLRVSPTTVTVRQRRTFDSSATPKIGQRSREPKILAKPELEALREKMQEAIERAKAEDPKELRKKIAQLERDLSARPIEPERIEVEVEKVVEVPVISVKVRETLRSVADEIVESMTRISETAAGLVDLATGLHTLTNEAPERPATVTPIRKAVEAPKPRPAEPAKRQAGFQPDGAFVYVLPAAEKAVLGVLAQYGNRGRSKQQIALLTGYSPTSGAFGQSLANLRKMDLIEGGSRLHIITAKGLSEIGDDFEPLPTGPQLREWWYGKLPKSEAVILRALADVYPDSLSKAEIAAQVGYSETSGAFGQSLANLRKRDLIEGGAAAYTASAELFQR
jgi:hypothetical protein